MTDEQIEAGLDFTLRRIEATRALYDILCALKRKDQPHAWNYSEEERKELQALHRKHLFRRAEEEAVKAGVEMGP